jgi:GTPase SAR1 family protein
VLQSGSSLVMVPQGSAARILILGDAGVGKSSFMYLLCHDGETLKRPHYTVGCDVDVLLHQSSEQATFFELVEVGGSPAFENSRRMWYGICDGIIGVCDVTNVNSRNNLDLWFREALSLTGLDVLPWVINGSTTFLDLSLHPDKRLSGRRVPVLVLANKLDLLRAKVCFVFFSFCFAFVLLL